MAERKVIYERIPIQKDIGLLITAPSYERLFIDAALASTDFRFSLSLIETTEQRKIEVAADNLRQLMSVWLESVFKLSQTDRFLPKRIVFDKFDGKSIRASLHGEIHNALKHGGVDSLKSLVPEGILLREASEPNTGFTVQIQYRSK